jgi:hypothetical protein
MAAQWPMGFWLLLVLRAALLASRSRIQGPGLFIVHPLSDWLPLAAWLWWLRVGYPLATGVLLLRCLRVCVCVLCRW